MADRIDNLTQLVQGVAEKLDQLSASVDKRFDAVEAGLLEQREYTEFVYERLEAQSKADIGRVERKLDKLLTVRLPRRTPKRGR